MKRVVKFFIVAFSMLILTQSLVADEKTDLKDSFLNLIDKVVVITHNKNLSKDERNSDILNLLTPTFDFKLMAKLSLGKKAWKKLEIKDRDKFTNLYITRMKQSYSAKLDSNSDGKVVVKKIEQLKKNRISLVTDFIGSDEKLDIVYKFYKPKKQISGKDRWLIYDVEILGVSILKTDKAQFKEFLQTRTIFELMKELA